MSDPPPNRANRNGQRGVVLFATLVSVLLLAALIAMVEAQEQANIKAMARISRSIQEAVAKDSVHERLRGLIALSAGAQVTPTNAPRLDGTPFLIREGGRDWSVRVQDVEGLVDVYLAPPEVLRLLPIDVPSFVAARKIQMAGKQQSERFPTLEGSLARFGVQSLTLLSIATQASQTGALRIRALPQELRSIARNMPPGIREREPPVRLEIFIQ